MCSAAAHYGHVYAGSRGRTIAGARADRLREFRYQYARRAQVAGPHGSHCTGRSERLEPRPGGDRSFSAERAPLPRCHVAFPTAASAYPGSATKLELRAASRACKRVYRLFRQCLDLGGRLSQARRGMHPRLIGPGQQGRRWLSAVVCVSAHRPGAPQSSRYMC